MLTAELDRVRSLSIVLGDIDVVLSEREISDQQKTDHEEISRSCRTVLDELRKTLGKYSKLEPSQGSFGSKVKRTWERLKWEPEDIHELRDRITMNVTLFNTFLGQLSR